MAVPLRLFLAAGWLRAGIEKVISPSWWTGDGVTSFLAEQDGHMLPFFSWFADGVIEPFALPTAWIVAEMQLAIGLCLLVGFAPRRALWAGVGLNVVFTMSGAVNPSAFYLVMQLALLVALSRPVPLMIAWRRAVAWLAAAVMVLPFAQTLHPAEAIDDPALMLAFVAGLAAVAGVAWSASVRPEVQHWSGALPPKLRTLGAKMAVVERARRSW